MKLPAFSNSLAFRILVPILFLWLAAGAGLYLFISGSVRDFLRVQADSNMRWMAHEAYGILNTAYDDLLRSGRIENERAVRIEKGRTLAEIEDFLRRQNAGGRVSIQKDGGVVLEVGLPEGFAAPGAEAPHDRTVRLESGREELFMRRIHFTPWGWDVTIVSGDPSLAALKEKVRVTYIALGVFLTFALILVVSAVNLGVKRPILEIVSQVRHGVRPSYRGVFELEFLSRTIAEMMDSLAELNRGLEATVRERTEDLLVKAAQLELANERLKELDRMKSAFLSSVSHELRTPLTSVLGFAWVIRRTFSRWFSPLAESDESLRSKAKTIEDNLKIITYEGERLTRLINDVLDLSKIESGRMQWQDETVEVGRALEHAAAAASGMFADKGEVRLEVEPPDERLCVVMDPDRLMQVLTNLLSNAAKFTARGRVLLRAGRKGEMVRFEVSDTGAGIDPAHHEEIFEIFQQASIEGGAGTKPDGTGLGLSICRQIVNHYDGTIWVESTPGRGSSFFFEIKAKQ